jgi:hypothetical protein
MRGSMASINEVSVSRRGGPARPHGNPAS